MSFEREQQTETSWPPERDRLLALHPRSSWPDAASGSAAFWLEVHAHLRRECDALVAAGEDYRAGAKSAAQLLVISGARLRGLVAYLAGHHEIEDFHYFPAFRHTAPELAAAFERLEAEHAALGRYVADAEAALTALRESAEQTSEPPGAALALAAQRYVAAADELSAHVQSHLTDEEDLVVPMLIERDRR